MHTVRLRTFEPATHEVPVPAVKYKPTYFGIQVAKIIQAELPLELCAYEVS